jgi:large subunit ribosomal protein L25
LPEGTKATIDRNFVIANISAPSGLKSQSVTTKKKTAKNNIPKQKHD